MGGAGDPPAPVGDPPTGTAESTVPRKPSLSPGTTALVPSGESPDSTGQWPVPPKTEFSDRLLIVFLILIAGDEEITIIEIRVSG